MKEILILQHNTFFDLYFVLSGIVTPKSFVVFLAEPNDPLLILLRDEFQQMWTVANSLLECLHKELLLIDLHLHLRLLELFEHLQLAIGCLLLLLALVFLDVAANVPEIESVDCIADETVYHKSLDLRVGKVTELEGGYLKEIAPQTAAKMHFLSLRKEID